MISTCPTCRATYPDGTVHCPIDTTPLLPDEAFANADAHLDPGTMVGEYRVEKLLGEGSFGAVYAGIQPLIGKKVAIKLLHKRMSSEPEIVSRFIDEARAVNRIGHRNIIDVFSFGVYDGSRHYFVMEFCDGMTLGQLLQEKKRLTPVEAMPILRGIADGLDAAHQAGVTHRDLKPDNVFLVRESGGGYFPKLLDFGVAKLVREEGAQQTATGIAIGTPRYMSPEQCRGKKIDHRTDIYALGCVAHEVLTGKPLFDADSTVDLLFKHTTEKPTAMSMVCPDIPPELDEPVLAMLAKRPAGRPNSAGAAVNALVDAVDRATRAGHASTVATNDAVIVRATGDSATVDVHSNSEDASSAKESGPATRTLRDTVATEIAAALPLQSQMPATLASAPLAAAVVDKPRDVTVVEAAPKMLGGSLATRPGGSSSRGLARQSMYVVAAFAGILIVVAMFYIRRSDDSPRIAAPDTLPSQTLQVQTSEPAMMTLRLAVMPADASIFVDGRRMGGPGDAIHLPRGKKQHAVRIERQGYESQTMWVSAESDREIGPISLAALAAAPAASQTSDKPARQNDKPATNKPRVNKDLWRPEELGGSK